MQRVIAHSPKKSGFTLIELMVVVSIIGLLSSIVLASVVSARNKARDQRLVSDMINLRTSAELYRSSNNGKYDIDGNFSGSDSSGSCLFGFFNDSSSGGLKITADIRTLNRGNNNIWCASGSNSWAFVSRLPSNTSQFICMDSSGNIMKGDSTLTINGNDDPYICGITTGGGGGETM